MDHTFRIWRHSHVLSVLKLEPVYVPVIHAPHDILLHAIAPVDFAFDMQIIRSAARRDFHNQFRGTLQVIIIADAGMATRCCINPQHGVWLWFIVWIKT